MKKEMKCPNFAWLKKIDSRVKFGPDGVMGYHRPVSEFNRGKKIEYYERKCYTENKVAMHLESKNEQDF